jgi:hypothetical protein
MGRSDRHRGVGPDAFGLSLADLADVAAAMMDAAGLVPAHPAYDTLEDWLDSPMPWEPDEPPGLRLAYGG